MGSAQAVHPMRRLLPELETFPAPPNLLLRLHTACLLPWAGGEMFPWLLGALGWLVDSGSAHTVSWLTEVLLLAHCINCTAFY